MAETKAEAERAFDFFLEAYGAKYDTAISSLPRSSKLSKSRTEKS